MPTIKALSNIQHNGGLYTAGETFGVDEGQYQQLLDAGTAEIVGSSSSTADTTEQKESQNESDVEKIDYRKYSKEEMQAYADEHDIAYDELDTRSDIYNKIKAALPEVYGE